MSSYSILKKQFYKLIGNEKEFSVQHRIFNGISLAAILMTIVTSICNFSLGLDRITYLFPLVSSLIFIGLYIYSIYAKRLFTISRVTFGYLLFVFVPFYWFINGGSLGGFHYFSFLFLIILILTVPGKKRWLIFLYFLILLAILGVEYFHPDLVVNYTSRTDRYIDIAVSFVFLYLIITVILKIVMRLYEQANQTLVSQKVKIQKAHKELEEVNRTKDKFFSILAHDLRSPYSSTLGLLELLNQNFDEFEQEDQKEMLSLIEDNVKSSYNLLENLLIWSRSQQGIMSFNPQKVDVYQLVEEVCEVFKYMIATKSITLSNELQPGVCLNVDRDMFSIILRNLLSNAIKFTPSGGDIVLFAETMESEDQPQATSIVVKDSGVGIAKEVQDKLFYLGADVSTRGTNNETGSGLGLLLCNEFVTKHNGEIRVKSEVEKGSEFIITIPAC